VVDEQREVRGVSAKPELNDSNFRTDDRMSQSIWLEGWEGTILWLSQPKKSSAATRIRLVEKMVAILNTVRF